MKNRQCFCFAIVLFFLISPENSFAKPKAEYKVGEVLVKFKSGYNGKGAAFVNQIGAKVAEKLSRIDVSRISLPRGLTTEKAIEKFRALPFVKFVEPNYIFKPTGWKPSDPKWNSQWGITKIRTAPAWSTETGNSKVIIAIVDSGVDANHPDLKNKMVNGYDFVDNDNSPKDDSHGHGTHCAGIAAAITNNATGIAGVCPNCAIMPIRVLGPNGGYASDVANGIIWAADHGAKVISLSLGGYYKSTTQQNAVEYAWNKGAIVIAASGNDGRTDPHYPAYHSKVLAVGSTDYGDKRASYSNYGNWVDVAAPGSNIISTLPGGAYGMKTGTSMATPFVSGLAGLLFSKLGHSATNQKVRNIIENNTVPVGNWLTHGRIDVYSAITKTNAISSPPSNSSTPAPTSGNQGVAISDSGYSPKGYILKTGTTIKAPSNSVVGADNSLLVLKSTQSGKNRYLDFYISSKIPKNAKIDSLKIVLKAKYYASSGPVTAYLWDWAGNKWDWIGRENINTQITNVTFNRSNAKSYVSSNGDVRVRFYRETKKWTTFELGCDFVRFLPSIKTSSVSSVKSKPRPVFRSFVNRPLLKRAGQRKSQPSKNEKSLKNEAKNALKKYLDNQRK